MSEKQVTIRKGTLEGNRYDSHIGGKGLKVSMAQKHISKSSLTTAVSS